MADDAIGNSKYVEFTRKFFESFDNNRNELYNNYNDSSKCFFIGKEFKEADEIVGLFKMQPATNHKIGKVEGGKV